MSQRDKSTLVYFAAKLATRTIATPKNLEGVGQFRRFFTPIQMLKNHTVSHEYDF